MRHLLLALALLLASLPARSFAEVPPAASSALPRKIALLKLVAESSRMRQEDLEKQALTVAALAARLNDPHAASKWIRDNTALVSYRGALRGADGVLEDRIGNSLDRSLLLLALLKSPSRELRLAHANLLPERAADLVEQARHPRAAAAEEDDANPRLLELAPQRLGADKDTLLPWLQAKSAEFKRDQESARAKLDSMSEAVAKILSEKAAPRPADPAAAAIAAKLLDELQDHWWVQLHEGEHWVDYDTTLPADGAARADAADTMAADELGDDRVARIGMRVIAEVSEHREAPRDVELLTQDWRGGTRLSVQASFSHVPRHALRTDLENAAKAKKIDAAALLKSHAQWIPILSLDNRPHASQAIALDGSTEDVDEAMLQAALSPGSGGGVSSAGNQAVDGAIDLFSKMGSESPADADSRLVGERVEFEITLPGEAPKVETRYLFKTSAAADLSAADAESVLLALTSTFNFEIDFARLSADRLAARLHRGAAATAELYAAILSNQPPEPRDLGDLTGFEPMIPAYQRLRWRAASRSAAFVAEPQITGVWHRMERSAKGFSAVSDLDIVRHALRDRTADAAEALKTQLRLGAADTVSELLSSGGPTAISNAAGALLDDEQHHKAWKVMTQGDAGLARLPELTRTIVQRELDAGAVVFGPAEMAAARPYYFFRVDPAAGTTLGMGPNGRGISSTERLVLLGNLAVCFESSLRPMAQYILGVGSPSDADLVAGGLAFPFCAVGGLTGTIAGRVGLGFALSMIGNIIAAVPDYTPHH